MLRILLLAASTVIASALLSGCQGNAKSNRYGGTVAAGLVFVDTRHVTEDPNAH
jgi:outer membrane murein-binding lipoprotein Lpp